MRLVDLEPKWLHYEGRRVGFIFRSPTNRDWWQSCFVEAFPIFTHLEKTKGGWFSPDSQGGIIERSAPEAGCNWQACNPACRWSIAGGITNSSFETMTVTPSLDGSAGGLWHGFIRNGEIVGGV